MFVLVDRGMHNVEVRFIEPIKGVGWMNPTPTKTRLEGRINPIESVRAEP